MDTQWIWAWIVLAIILMPTQFLIAAPYGRHTNRKWGPQINSKVGWIAMELVALTAFVLSYFMGHGAASVTLVITGLFTLHYIHRSIIYPLMTRTGSKSMPILIVLFAVMFNVVNGFINGDYLGTHPEMYPDTYFATPKFIIGLILFISGAVINIKSDYALIALRKKGEEGKYFIPRGGLFNWISCPNHFGEIIEWTGFAVMCWNLPAVAFAAWTISNLVPRAWQHHKWYKAKFEDYPKNRKAIIPWLF